jgi:hypothetical protein
MGHLSSGLLQCFFHPPKQSYFGGGLRQPSSCWTSKSCGAPCGPLCSRAGIGRQCPTPATTAECPKVRYHVCDSMLAMVTTSPGMLQTWIFPSPSDLSCGAPKLFAKLPVSVIDSVGLCFQLSFAIADQRHHTFCRDFGWTDIKHAHKLGSKFVVVEPVPGWSSPTPGAVICLGWRKNVTPNRSSLYVPWPIPKMLRCCLEGLK